MKIVAGIGQYVKGTNKELGDKFVENITKYFKQSFPNGTLTGGHKMGLGESISFSFVLGNPKVTPRNDQMFHSVMIQWSDGFGRQEKTIEEGADLEFNVLSSGIATKPKAGSYLARDRVNSKLTNVKKGGTLEKFDKKMKDFFPKLKKMVEEEIKNNNLYQQEQIEKVYLQLGA